MTKFLYRSIARPRHAMYKHATPEEYDWRQDDILDAISPAATLRFWRGDRLRRFDFGRYHAWLDCRARRKS